MKALIGNTLISKLAPKEKQYDVRDTKLPGFLIRVNPSGNMLYVCQYQRGRRINLGRVGVLTPAQARDKAIAILANVAKGIDPHSENKSNKITLKEFLVEHYKPWIIEHRKTGKATYSHIDRCYGSSFGNKTLNELTPALIDQWRTQRLKDGNSTEPVNRYIANFKAAISKAVLWGFIDVHPLEKLKLLKTDRTGKIRFLSSSEEKNLRQALLDRDERIKKERLNGNQWREERGYKHYPAIKDSDFSDHLHPMVLISINTGMRQGELFNLRWNNINFERAIMTIEAAYAKSGKARHIPLNTEALNTLKTWRKQTKNTELIFPNKDGNPFNNVKKAWARLLKIAEIKNFRWHDLRHHFASWLVMAGVDLNTVRELLGHSDMTMTLRYAHLAPEHKANAVEKLVTNKISLNTTP